LKVVNVTQLEKDTLLICLELCLQDNILAFHDHGMQGKSFRSNEITQEICDRSRIFRLLSSYMVIVLESKPTENPKELLNLYILAGHEDMT